MNIKENSLTHGDSNQQVEGVMNNLMKFIGNLCLCFIGFATIWVATLLFASNASIYSWGAVVVPAIATALISNHYDGKHDD